MMAFSLSFGKRKRESVRDGETQRGRAWQLKRERNGSKGAHLGDLGNEQTEVEIGNRGEEGD